MAKDFPKEVFEDVNPGDFEKYNKKGVSEDFVTENFKELGWSCFRPFDDTGVDLVARKAVCPQNHTEWNMKEKEIRCQDCNSELITITRFIQIKTREKDEKGKVGYTLDPADIRADPRHTVLIYSDATLDFLILPIYEYLKFFHDNESAGGTHFGTPSFRYENNKVNNLHFTETGSPKFHWSDEDGDYSWDVYLNDKGMEKLSNPLFENDFANKTKEIAKMKLELFYRYRSGQEIQGPKPCVVKKKKANLTKADKKKIKVYENAVKKVLKTKTSKTAEKIVKMREQNKKNLWNKIKDEEELVNSIKKALRRFRREIDFES